MGGVEPRTAGAATSGDEGGPEPSAARRRLFPALEWLRTYRLGWLRGDLVAGFTLAAYSLPAGIGDASLAGLPPEAGLYACLFSALVFWAFCSSRHTAVTVTSAISLLVGTSLGDLAGGDPERYATLAAALAVLVAVLAFVTWLARAGEVVKFVSETVLVGFKAGVALHLASTQLPKLFGFKGSHGDFWERAGHFLSHLGETHPLSLAFGCCALAVLLLGKRFLPNRPVAIVVLVGGILAASSLDAAARGVKTLGEVPQGFPAPRLPALSFREENELFPLALACFLLAGVETAAIGRMFAKKHGYRLDSNQEFLALAGSNLAAGVGGGYPVSGGMSQSLVNEGGGARTPLSGLVSAGVLLVTALFLSGLLADLPQPVLAAIVLVAVLGLFKVDAMKRIWRFGRAEFAVAAASLLGVLGSGLLRGVLIGAVLSIVLLLRRGSRPPTAELGRVPGTDYFANLERHPENQGTPGTLVFRVEGALLYFNVEHVRDRLFALLGRRREPVRRVVFFMGGVPGVDLAGAEFLAELHHDLAGRGVELRLAELRDSVCESLRRAGYEEEASTLVPHERISKIVAETLPPAPAVPPGGSAP